MTRNDVIRRRRGGEGEWGSAESQERISPTAGFRSHFMVSNLLQGFEPTAGL